jgi:hypothetical protein
VFCRRRQALANEQPAWKLGDLRRTPNPFGIRAQKRKHIAPSIRLKTALEEPRPGLVERRRDRFEQVGFKEHPLCHKKAVGKARLTASSLRGVRRNHYRGGRDLRGSPGSNPRAGSPAATRPPTSTTPNTPHLKRGSLLSARMTCRLRPTRYRSMSKQGVLRPVNLTAAIGPRRKIVPTGNRSRSRPAVVTFSPSSPGDTL